MSTSTMSGTSTSASAQDVLVEVNEAGTGTDPGPHGSGRGLIGPRERVAIFAGQLDAGPRPEGGWRLAATLPVAR